MPFIHSFIHSFVRSFVRSALPSLVYLFIYLSSTFILFYVFQHKTHKSCSIVGSAVILGRSKSGCYKRVYRYNILDESNSPPVAWGHGVSVRRRPRNITGVFTTKPFCWALLSSVRGVDWVSFPVWNSRGGGGDKTHILFLDNCFVVDAEFF